jgi:hypothetical protein
MEMPTALLYSFFGKTAKKIAGKAHFFPGRYKFHPKARQERQIFTGRKGHGAAGRALSVGDRYGDIAQEPCAEARRR